jgi:hypothetical protein
MIVNCEFGRHGRKQLQIPEFTSIKTLNQNSWPPGQELIVKSPEYTPGALLNTPS